MELTGLSVLQVDTFQESILDKSHNVTEGMILGSGTRLTKVRRDGASLDYKRLHHFVDVVVERIKGLVFGGSEVGGRDCALWIRRLSRREEGAVFAAEAVDHGTGQESSVTLDGHVRGTDHKAVVVRVGV